MTRRRVLCGLLLVSAMLACLAGVFLIASGPRVSQARFKQVNKGMSRQEVIRIVGGPPGDYSSGQYATTYGRARNYWQVEGWFCDDGELLIHFDHADSAAEVVLLNVDLPRSPTLTERIRRWLGL
jgi:hypothetical protein